jgi:hypothetical protein
MSIPNPKIVLTKISETTESASFEKYVRDSAGNHEPESMNCTPYAIEIPFARKNDRSIDAPINPMLYSAVNQGYPMVLLPEDFAHPVQENPPYTPAT